MLNAYGFVNIKNFIKNTPGVTAVIGELSAKGYTYSTEVGSYQVTDYSDVQLKTFSVERDGVLAELGLTYYSQILQISQWIYLRSVNGLITDDTQSLLQALNGEFSSFATFTSVGTILNNGSYKFPSSLVMSFTNAGESNNITVWYADANFLVEYPGKEFTVVFPMDDINVLTGAATTAVAAINAITLVGHTARIQTAIGNNPQTEIWTSNFTWVSLENDEITLPLPISVIIYGAAGINLDYIKDAIRESILGNSTETREVWEKVLPDLFTPTEYFVVPVWDRISLPNQLDSTSLYSPIVPYKDQLTYTDKYMPEYTQAHVIDALEVVATTYQNLQLLICGHIRNYNVSYVFSDVWPKYAAIAPTSSEFGKIPEATRNFIIVLLTLLKTAESATATSILPTGYTRTQRSGIYYITATVDTVQYLTPIKDGFTKG